MLPVTVHCLATSNFTTVAAYHSYVIAMQYRQTVMANGR